MKKEKDYTIVLMLVVLVIAALSSCSNTKLNRPQAIYSNKDSSFVLIGGNALHWQQRADYKAKKRAEKDSINKIANN